MVSRRLWAAALVMLAGALPAVAEAQPGSRRDLVISTQTVRGTVVGLEIGDYLWVRIRDATGGQISAQPGPTPVELFLNTYRGRPMTLILRNVQRYIPEAGGRQTITIVADARVGSMNVAYWWGALTPGQRRTAQQRFDQGVLRSGGRR